MFRQQGKQTPFSSKVQKEPEQLYKKAQNIHCTDYLLPVFHVPSPVSDPAFGLTMI